MHFPYNSDPEGDVVLRCLRALLTKKRSYLSADRNLIFICGGDRNGTNLRSKFLAHAAPPLPNARIVLAEDAFADLMASSYKKFKNLMLFERILADLADCIVIFPESAGSFTELGYFSAVRSISEKLLAVNPLQFQAVDSFVNLGPLAVINAKSNYRPTLMIDNGTPNFADISVRIDRFKTASPRRKTYNHKPFNELSRPEQLYSVSILIRALRIIHVATLPRAIQVVFDRQPIKEQLREMIAILIATKQICRCGEEMRFIADKDEPPFLEVDGIEGVLIEANRYLLKHHAPLFVDIFGP